MRPTTATGAPSTTVRKIGVSGLFGSRRRRPRRTRRCRLYGRWEADARPRELERHSHLRLLSRLRSGGCSTRHAHRGDLRTRNTNLAALELTHVQSMASRATAHSSRRQPLAQATSDSIEPQRRGAAVGCQLSGAAHAVQPTSTNVTFGGGAPRREKYGSPRIRGHLRGRENCRTCTVTAPRVPGQNPLPGCAIGPVSVSCVGLTLNANAPSLWRPVGPAAGPTRFRKRRLESQA